MRKTNKIICNCGALLKIDIKNKIKKFMCPICDAIILVNANNNIDEVAESKNKEVHGRLFKKMIVAAIFFVAIAVAASVFLLGQYFYKIKKNNDFDNERIEVLLKNSESRISGKSDANIDSLVHELQGILKNYYGPKRLEVEKSIEKIKKKRDAEMHFYAEYKKNESKINFEKKQNENNKNESINESARIEKNKYKKNDYLNFEENTSKSNDILEKNENKNSYEWNNKNKKQDELSSLFELENKNKANFFPKNGTLIFNQIRAFPDKFIGQEFYFEGVMKVKETVRNKEYKCFTIYFNDIQSGGPDPDKLTFITSEQMGSVLVEVPEQKYHIVKQGNDDPELITSDVYGCAILANINYLDRVNGKYPVAFVKSMELFHLGQDLPRPIKVLAVQSNGLFEIYQNPFRR